MEFRRACIACEHPANPDADRCTECGESVPLEMVALRGAASARQLSARGLLLRMIVLGALTLISILAFLSGIERTAALSHRLTWIETFGLFGLRAGLPLLFGLAFGYGAWEALMALLGRGTLRTEVRVIVTPEGVWCSSDDPTYPTSRRAWSTLEGVKAEAKGDLLRVRAMRPLKPLDLLWQKLDSAAAAEAEAAALNAMFAALQAAAPKTDQGDALDETETAATRPPDA